MWVKLSDDWQDNIKIIRAGRDGRDLWLAGLTFSNRNHTGGFVSNDDLAYIAAKSLISCDPTAIVERLVRVGLWEAAEGGWTIHDYKEYNSPPDKLEAIAEIRAEAGRMGGIRSGQARRARTKGGPEANEANTKQIAVETGALLEANVKQTRSPGTRYPVPGSGVPVPEESKLSADNLAAGAAVPSLHDVREDLLRRCSAAKKKAAIVGEAFVYCFRSETKPVFGRLAHLSTIIGGPNKLIMVMFECSPHWDEYGDPHDYLTRVVQSKSAKLNGRGSINANIIQPRPRREQPEPEIPTTPEEEAEIERQHELQRARLADVIRQQRERAGLVREVPRA